MNNNNNLPFPQVKAPEALLFVDAHLGHSPEQVSCAISQL